MNRTINVIKWYVRWIYRSSKGIKGRLLAGTLLGILRVFLGLVFVWVSKQMVDIATGAKSGDLWMGVIGLSALIIGEVAISSFN